MKSQAVPRTPSGFGAFCSLASLLLLGLTGCVTERAYQGPPRPPEQIAIIKPGFKNFNEGFAQAWTGETPHIYIFRCDGRRLERPVWDPASDRLEVLPGAHTLSLTYELSSDVGTGYLVTSHSTVGTVTFTATAGHVYVARAVEDKDGWTAEIVDTASGEVLARARAQPWEAGAAP